MMQNLFDLDFSRMEVMLLFWFPAFINLIIFLYAYIFLSKTVLTSFFSYLILVIMFWQIAEGCISMSATLIIAEEWAKISGVLVMWVVPLGIQFALFFAEKYTGKSARVLSILLFLPSVLFFALIINGSQLNQIMPSNSLYWVTNPQRNIFALSFYAWIAMGGFSMITIFLLIVKHTKKRTLKYKQALLLLLGISLPIISGIFFEIIAPLFSTYNDLPVTAPLLSLFSLLSFIAIKRFQFLDYSPKHQLDKILETMNDGILIVDNDDRIQFANQSFCNTLGYTFDEIKGKKAKNLFLDEQQKSILANALKKRSKNTSSQYEIQLKAKSGKMVWMLIRGSDYRDKNGKVIGSIGVQTNISYLKEIEKILEYNKARLNQAQEVAMVGSWELNFVTNKVICSDEVCKIFGLSVHDKTEKTFELWLSFIHPEDIGKVKNEIEKSRINSSDSFIKHRIVLNDGSVKHIHSVFRYEFNQFGKPTGLFGVFHDITEQTEAERALIESEKNMREFIEESLMCVVLFDPASKKFLYANSAFCELLGYSHEELDNMLIYDFNNYPKEILDARIDDLMKNGKIKNSEREWIRKDRKIIHVTTSLFFQKRGRSNVIYVTAHDITERKLTESRLEVANTELETFIYKTSHDIRGPLASILGLVNVSKSEIKNVEATRYLEMIGSSTQKLDNTLIELVKAMKISDAQKFSDKIEFSSMAEDALNKFVHFPGYQKLKISLNVEVSTPFFSNKSILETILQNLIENSIKYQNLKSKNPYLKIDLSETDKFVKIMVADNGIGIDAELHDKLYDMYFRANSSIKGSGLGLYLVKKGVDKLNGEIKVQSELNIGTTFTILLPIK